MQVALAVYRFLHRLPEPIRSRARRLGAGPIADRVETLLSRRPMKLDVDGRTLWVDPADKAVAHSLVVTGRWHPAASRAIRRRLRPGDVFVDAGAHIGYFATLAATLVGETGIVWAFEPDPRNHLLLRRNVEGLAMGANMRTFNLALGDRRGELVLHRDRTNHGNHTFVASNVADPADGVVVRVDRLDAICSREGVSKVDFLKVDVQGWESFVLRGAYSMLAPGCHVLVEYWPEGIRAAGSDPEELFSELEGRGEIRLISEADDAVTTRPEILAACARAPSGQVDLLVTIA